MFNFDNRSSLGENDTYVVDISGGSNNGTVSGAEWTSAGKYGGAYEFEGNSSDYIETGLSDNFNKTSWTISLWYKFTGECYNSAYLIGKNYKRKWYINANCHLKLQTRNQSDDDVTVAVTNEEVADGDWHHAVQVYNYTENWTYLYFDGIKMGGGLALNGSKVDNNINYTIGNLRPNFEGAFNGTIDEVKIWNRALSAEEVYELYASNLVKYNTDKWALYINQSKNATSGLDPGIYTYFASAKDIVGNENKTRIRSIRAFILILRQLKI